MLNIEYINININIIINININITQYIPLILPNISAIALRAALACLSSVAFVAFKGPRAKPIGAPLGLCDPSRVLALSWLKMLVSSSPQRAPAHVGSRRLPVAPPSPHRKLAF